jgi:hypothetical protein
MIAFVYLMDRGNSHGRTHRPRAFTIPFPSKERKVCRRCHPGSPWTMCKRWSFVWLTKQSKPFPASVCGLATKESFLAPTDGLLQRESRFLVRT